jgi:transcriptional regulator with XRE-family HTH domain
MPAASAAFGAHLRIWRTARQLSQEALAGRAGVSPRHLSFVENGRSQPSRELVLALVGALDVPLRERNTLLASAGFAAVYRSSPLDGDELRHLRLALDRILAQQEPFGAVVLGRTGNVLRINQGGRTLLARFPPRSTEGVAAFDNVLVATLHPDGLRPYIVNWLDVAAHLVARLHREIAASPGDDESRRLLTRVLALPGVPADWRAVPVGKPAGPFVPVHLRNGDLELRLFTMLTSIGTPLDVTAEEIRIETYFPADDATEAAIRAL